MGATIVAVGTTVIDSSAWRMDPNTKLVVPEVKASTLNKNDKIIANPCSTIQMVSCFAILHLKYKIKRVVVSTWYVLALVLRPNQLMNERKDGNSSEMA